MRAYVHVPFCRQKCGYCKFALTPFVRETEVERYFIALEKEIAAFCDADVGLLETLYFWGGTPSAVGAERIGAVIRQFSDRFGWADDAEITVEANPEDLTEDFCRSLRGFGVNRLSVGVQSLDDRVLRAVGRTDSATVFRAFESAFSAGFANVNADIIVWLPHERPGGSLAALKALHERFPLAHSSVYLLEAGAYPKAWEGTRFEGEALAQEYEACREFLVGKGFRHYEVSNFAKPGFESKHNRGYWERRDVLGFGLSAASLWRGERFENAASFSLYYRGQKVACETLSQAQVKLEEALCGIRTFSLPAELVSDRAKLAEFAELWWLAERDGKIVVTSAWIIFLDHIMSGLI